MVSGEVKEESTRRRELSDEDFLVEWFDQTQPRFMQLAAGPIELLRKRSVKVFYAKPGNRTSK